jgi:hypothetical protein
VRVNNISGLLIEEKDKNWAWKCYIGYLFGYENVFERYRRLNQVGEGLRQEFAISTMKIDRDQLLRDEIETMFWEA